MSLPLLIKYIHHQK